ncbi:MAG: CYTH domain-containing protein [Proteobacteria bacterium]|nr:CYTH domain-containing protein [Pseudomonadota bacterium]
MSQDLRFLEIEHKFLVDKSFDPEPFLGTLRKLLPEKMVEADVQDTYFLLEHAPQLIYRHRLDHQLQELTVKSLVADPEVRLEVNLNLSLSLGNQLEFVQAFLAPLGILWQGSLHKLVKVFYFPNAEIVFYEADFEGKTVRCIEIEARGSKSIQEAQSALKDWEKLLGLDQYSRSPASLLELLVVPTLSAELKSRMQSSHY